MQNQDAVIQRKKEKKQNLYYIDVKKVTRRLREKGGKIQN